MSLREEQCKKVCRILDDVLANRPTERDSLIVAVRKAFAEPKRGKWIDTGSNEEWYAREYRCSECGDTMLGEANFCPNCGADMREGGENE